MIWTATAQTASDFGFGGDSRVMRLSYLIVALAKLLAVHKEALTFRPPLGYLTTCYA